MRKLHLCKAALIFVIGFLFTFTGTPAISETQNQDGSVALAEKSMPTDMDMVEVTDAASLLAAIQPNRTIKLLPGDYNFSTLITTEATQSQQEYADYKDGAVTIRNVSNLALIASEPQEIYSENFRDTVLSFENCSQVSVTGISCGHHNKPEQQCFSGVMWLSGCSDFKFAECDFYGCGYTGPTIFGCNLIVFTNCVIRDCSTAAVNIFNSFDIIFNHTEIFGICTDGYYPDWLFLISDSKSVSFNACSIHNNGCGKTGSTYPMFMVYQMNVNMDESVTINECTIDNN